MAGEHQYKRSCIIDVLYCCEYDSYDWSCDQSAIANRICWYELCKCIPSVHKHEQYQIFFKRKTSKIIVDFSMKEKHSVLELGLHERHGV